MLESLHDLSKQLESYGECLYVVQGHTLLSLERICEKWNVRKLFYLVSRDVGSHIMEDAVDNLVKSMNIEVSGVFHLRTCRRDSWRFGQLIGNGIFVVLLFFLVCWGFFLCVRVCESEGL